MKVAGRERRELVLALAGYDQVEADLAYQAGLAQYAVSRVVTEDLYERRAVIIEQIRGLEKDLAR